MALMSYINGSVRYTDIRRMHNYQARTTAFDAIIAILPRMDKKLDEIVYLSLCSSEFDAMLCALLCAARLHFCASAVGAESSPACSGWEKSN